MRSRDVVKRTIPCLAVVLAVTMQGNVAHAGIISSAKAQIASLLSKAGITTSDKSAASAQTGQSAQKSPVNSNMFTGSKPYASTSAAVNAGATVAAAAVADAAVETAVQQPSVQEKTWTALQTLQNQINTSYTNTTSDISLDKLRGAVKVQFEKVENVNNENHSLLLPQYTEKDLVFKLRVDETSLKNPELLLKDVSMILALSHTVRIGGAAVAVERTIESPHSWAEGSLNAAEGSVVSQARLKGIEKAVLESAIVSRAVTALGLVNTEETQKATEQLAKETAKLTKEVPELDEKAAKYARQQQKALDKWRSETGALDKYEAMNLKLNDLMLNNDRKGVRDMLEAYLPWQIMEPTEYKAWKTWLEAIEHPDLSKTTVAFRGLDYKTDKIQRMEITKGGEEKFAFMSTVLTKNQGSYTRRLRSLVTNREKNGDEGQNAFKEKALAIKITDQMTAHARDPKASSFLSFTYDPSVARRFVGRDVEKTVKGEKVVVANGGLLAVRVDSRRMVPNVVSMYSSEIELLAPLIIFPDEVVAYHEGDFASVKDGKDGSTRSKEFITKVSEKTGVDFTSWGVNYDTSTMFKERFKKDGLTFFRELSEQAVNAPLCSKIF